MWLLEPSVLARLNLDMAAYKPAAGECVKAAPVEALSLSDSGRTAVIPVHGILTKQADPLISFFFGANTAYDDIIAQVAMADNDPKVTNVIFDIDSPGGNIDGMFEAMAAIGSLTKPSAVNARNANSAAYALAATAGNITAANPGSTFGSIGIVASIAVTDDVVTLTSTDAPDKRPDPTTEEGKAAIVRHLDAVSDLFVSGIAEGRGVSPDAVKQGFGRGATLLAGEAKERGMIDGIAGTGLRVVRETQASASGGSEEGKMTLEELKAQHPALYQAVVELGVKQERDRVCAHLQGGEMSGAAAGGLKIALEAIRAGGDLTQTASMQYLTAAHNKRDIEARNEDDDAVTEATKAVKPPKKAVDEMDKLQGETLKLLQGMVGNGGI